MASEKFTALAELLSRSGIAALRFDHGGCGASTGTIADTTVSRRLQELEAVIRFADNHSSLGRSCGLMGSSLGGFIALLFAGRHPFKALSLWATPYDLAIIKDNIPPEDLQRLKPVFFTDAARYSLEKACTHTPAQFIHGMHDTLVPVDHAEQLYAKNTALHRLIILPGADHTISNEHHRAKALSECCVWFKQHLKNT